MTGPLVVTVPKLAFAPAITSGPLTVPPSAKLWLPAVSETALPAKVVVPL